MSMAVHRKLSVILAVLAIAGALCILVGHGPGVDLCFPLLALTPAAVSFINLVPAGRIVLPACRRPWLLLHPSPRAPI